jgi:LCP family protein required for cell wall assembly
MNKKKPDFLRAYQRPTVGQFVLLGSGLVLAVALAIFLNNFVACWRLTSLAGVQPASCPQVEVPTDPPDGTPDGTPDASPTPALNVPQVELPPPWDGASRVTILIIGLDYRDWEEGLGAPRSDTLILLTVDPITRTAGMLSVPRDLWVNIPGFGYSKINNAYAFGQSAQLPGGGPALTIKTLENFLGINIDYYAQVDFLTFEQMIDIIGGICLDVPEEIKVGRTYMHSVTLEPGYQCLDGKVALGYARARYTEGGDVDRAGRQQQVIFAIRDKVLAPENFTNLVVQAPQLYNALSSGINTNLSLDDALRLAMLVKDIDLSNIQTGVIDYSMADIGSVDVNGQTLSIMRPYPDAIRDLVDSIFGGGSIQPLAAGEILDLVRAEQARVAVVNGSGIEGLASRTADYLRAQGLNVVGFGNTGDYPADYRYPFPDRSLIIIHTGRTAVIKYLFDLLQVNTSTQIIFDFDPQASADIVVALGSDWGYSNPLP